MVLGVWCVLGMSYGGVGGVGVAVGSADEQEKTGHLKDEKLGKLVVGYVPKYRLKGLKVEHLKGVTDLVYFGMEIGAEGELVGRVEAWEVEKLKLIREKVGCRVMVCVGGWGRSEHFAKVCGDIALRERFVGELVKFCERYGFDGVDYDWEHPKGEREVEGYVELVKLTRRRFEQAADKRVVSVAQASWQNLGKRMYAAVDRVHLMSYDHAYPQATFEKSTADVERLLGWECPGKKLVLGVPFYGRDKARNARAYRDLKRVWGKDNQGEVPDVVEGFALNGKQTLRKKMGLIRDKQLRGVMVWELGQDDEGGLLKVLAGERKMKE